jgi:hypothetical protein
LKTGTAALSLRCLANKKQDQRGICKVHVSMTRHSDRHAVAIRDCMPTHLITLEKLMSKLMTSLVAATIVGAFSMSAFAAEATKATPATPAGATTPAAEKPAAAPKKATKKRVKKHATKATTSATPAEPAKK